MVMGGKENQAFVLTADQGNEGKEKKMSQSKGWGY